MRPPPALVLTALLAGLAAGPSARAQAPAAPLETALRAVLARHPDVLVAVSVRDRATGTALDLNGDSVLHAASTMKVPVLVELHRQAEAGALGLADTLGVVNRFRSIVDGSPYRIEDDSDDSLRHWLGRPMRLDTLAERMITVSSNLATNLLVERLGPANVQATMERLGVRRMRVRRGVEDGKAFQAGLNNVTTSRDLAVVLDRLAHGEAVSPAADAAMRAVLLRQRFNSMIPAGLPPGTPVAHKTGWITRHAHDAAVVLPGGRPPYVLVVLTRGFATQEDADPVVAEIARLVHAHLRP